MQGVWQPLAGELAVTSGPRLANDGDDPRPTGCRERWPRAVYHADGLNAYLDVYLRVGIVGVLLFVALIALAFSRSWLLASNRRSVVYAWAPLVLVSLLVTSVFESSILIESGWMLLLICTVKASQGMSWRLRLPHRDGDGAH